MSQTEVKLHFKNTSDNPIELSVLIPELPNCTLTRIEMTLDMKKVVSKILEKEKTKDKYSNIIVSDGIISKNIKENKEINVCLGKIPRDKKIELKIFYFGNIKYQDCSYQAFFPTIFPKLIIYDNNKNKKAELYKYEKEIVEGEIYINCFSKLTRLVIKDSSYFDKLKKKYLNSNITAKINITKNTFSWKNIPGIILFRTEKINESKLYVQYDSIKDQTYYFSKGFIEIPEFKMKCEDKIDEDENLSYSSLLIKKNLKYKYNIGCYIFLIDQSYSMNGKSMEICIDALLLFIQSLNKGSFFHLIGFGSGFKYYTERPLPYKRENIMFLNKTIKNLKADKGGTELYKPLKSIFENKIYRENNICKNIFLLTDGEIFDKETTLNLIGSHSDEFTLHSIGITDCDKDLIKRSAIMGKGHHYIINDLNELNKSIISALENSQSDKIISKIEINKNPIIEQKKTKIVGINEIINHGFILKGKKIEEIIMKIIIKKDENKTEEIKVNWNKNDTLILPEGDKLGKIIIDDYLKNNITLVRKLKLSYRKNLIF